jgi:hypothetical protein
MNEEDALDIVTRNGLELRNLERFKNNKNVVMTAVATNGMALIYASEFLKNDKDVVTNAIRQNGGALTYASDAFKKDKHYATMAIQQNGIAICFTPFLPDRELCKLALKTNPHAFRCFKFYRNDKELAMLAVSKHRIINGNGLMLEFVKDELNDDIDVVMAAVNSYGVALQYASDRLKDDETIVMAAIQQSVMALKYASPMLKQQKHIVMFAIAHGNVVDYIDPIFNDDLVVIMAMLERNNVPNVDVFMEMLDKVPVDKKDELIRVRNRVLEEYLNIYFKFASLRCKMDTEVLNFMYNKFKKPFLYILPPEVCSNPDVLDWLTTSIPKEDIPVQCISSLKTYKKISADQLQKKQLLKHKLQDNKALTQLVKFGGKSQKRNKKNKRTKRR